MAVGRAARRPDELDPRLPVKAGRRKLDLYERKQDAEAVNWALGDEEHELFNDVQRSKARIAQVKSLIRSTSYQSSPKAAEDAEAGEDHAAVISEREKLARFESKLARVRARREKARSVSEPILRVLDGIERYLDGPGGFTDTAPARPAKGDTIAVVSERIASLRADLAEVDAAPWPSDDAKARAAAEVDFLASRGAITVGASIDNRGSLKWPLQTTNVVMGAPDERGLPDPYDRKTLGPETALIAWLFRDQLVARLHQEIDAIADDECALSAEDRIRRTAKIKDDLLKEQRILAEIIWRDEAHKLWPADIDPRAVLGIDGPAPKELWS
jgi:hypothetical protein